MWKYYGSGWIANVLYYKMGYEYVCIAMPPVLAFFDDNNSPKIDDKDDTNAPFIWRSDFNGAQSSVSSRRKCYRY